MPSSNLRELLNLRLLLNAALTLHSKALEGPEVRFESKPLTRTHRIVVAQGVLYLLSGLLFMLKSHLRRCIPVPGSRGSGGPAA